MYNIEIKSSFEGFWRYNIMVMCAGYNHAGEQIFVTSGEDIIAQIGEELTSKPGDYPSNRVLQLQTPPASQLRLLIYVIPHTLPLSSNMNDSDPFELSVEVSSRSERVYISKESVNQWSGDSFDIEI
ncbi:MAG: hypothetical protein SNJ33_03870 [Rikenellaceae bacterium]